MRSQLQTKEVIRQHIDLMYELALRDMPNFAGFWKSRDANSYGLSTHFDPNQPRAPAGSLGGGQWLSSGGLLHKWEQKTVNNLKLEKYWQKTPFQIEI